MSAGRSSRTSRTGRSKRAGPGKTRRSAPLVLSARLNSRLMLQVAADGSVAASFDGYGIPLGVATYVSGGGWGGMRDTRIRRAGPGGRRGGQAGGPSRVDDGLRDTNSGPQPLARRSSLERR